jgi:nitroreductase
MATVKLDPPEKLNMAIGEAMFTQRAIRKLKPDPISDADLKTVLDAASKAPNSGNEQPLRFLVIRSRQRIEAFGQLYHESWWAKRADEGWSKPEELPDTTRYRAPRQLADEMKDVPVVVLAIATEPNRADSVLPAAQNLMLAARALGIGSVLTTLNPKVVARAKALFHIPADAQIHCCIPLGYPRGRFGPTRRLPVAETTYYDDWGNPPPWE